MSENLVATQKDRIIEFREFLQMSQRAFELSIGVSISAVAHSKGNLSADIINKACATYPALNRMWLLTGEGPMLNTNKGVPEYLNVTGDGNITNGSGTQTIHQDSEEVKHLRERVRELELENARLQGMIEILEKHK